MVQSLISQSPDIQKILAFEGAFEKLFNTIEQEGGVEGGIVAHDALICVDGLLRFNTSNQVDATQLIAVGFTKYITRAIFGKYLSLQFFVNYFSLRPTCSFMNQPLRNSRYNFGMIRRPPTHLW
jgi:hypothetical protein